MTEPFRQLGHGALATLAAALEAGRLTPPYRELGLERYVHKAARAVAAELQRLQDAGVAPAHIAYALRLLAAERAAVELPGERVQLVWSGPEAAGAMSRDTGVVVRELFANAERSVIVAGFAVYQGKQVFAELARRMDERASLEVKMFLNVSRPHLDDASDAELLHRFATTFAQQQWPGRRLPRVFHDPRALAPAGAERAALHAKCVIADDRRAFVTSANFTEAAQERNIEAGVLIDDASFALSLRGQFETLVTAGLLCRVPGLG